MPMKLMKHASEAEGYVYRDTDGYDPSEYQGPRGEGRGKELEKAFEVVEAGAE